MKASITIFSFLIFSTIAMAQYQKPFEVFQENKQFGLRDLNKQVVVKPIYKNIKASPFGVFAIQDNHSKWALFDTDGIRVTDFQFDNMEQRLPKIIELRQGGLVGLFDDKGNELIPVKYNKITAVGKVFLSELGRQNNNMKPKNFLFRGAIVTKGNLSGFVNQNGQEVLEISYQRIKATANFLFDLGVIDVIGLIIKKNNLYGMIDEKGQEIFPMNYSYINSINQSGFGEIQQNGKKGLYNSKFETVSKPQFDNILILNERLFAGQINNEWSIYTTEKPTESILNCSAVKPLANKYSKVSLNNKNGAIDSNGNLVIPFEYDAISVFGENLLLIKNKENYIFTSDKQIKPWTFPKLITWYNQGEKLKSIRFKNGKIGFINDNAETVIDGKFEQATAFIKKVAIVCKDGKCGFINPNGDFILPMEYELPTLNYQPNYLLAKRGGKYGYLDYQGQTIIPIIYDEISVFQPIMKVKKDGKYGFINEKETLIIPFKYDFIESFETNKKEFRFIDKDQFGWVSLKGVERYSVNLATWADKIHPIENDVQNIKVGNNFGLLDAKDNWITPIQYDKYISFNSLGKAIVRANKKWGMINKKGQILIPLVYDEQLKFNQKGFACIRKNGQFGTISSELLRINFSPSLDILKLVCN